MRINLSKEEINIIKDSLECKIDEYTGVEDITKQQNLLEKLNNITTKE